MKKLLSLALALIMCLAVFASCNSSTTDDDDLTAAREFIYNMYKDSATVTNSDYTVVSVLMIGMEQFTVDWSADVTSGDASSVTVIPGETETTVDVNEQTSSEVAYTLTATIKNASGKSVSVSFSHTIPAYKEFNYNDFKASADDDSVVIKGVVTGIISKSKGNSNNCLYLQDDVGGFYVYGMSDDPVVMGIKEGMTVKVSGAKDTYSGTLEIVNATVEIADDSVVKAVPVDYTEIFSKAASLKDDALVGTQALLVTIKGVTVTGEDTSSGYYKFKLGSLETYVRISSSVCPLNSDDQKTFKAEHASHTGYTANVTGVICIYDGAFYLTPVTVDAFEYLSLPEKTDAEKVAFEKENLTLDSKVSAAKEISLSSKGASYDAVSISWASDNSCAVVKDGKLVITLPEKDQTVNITATLTCGSSKDTKTFTMIVEAAQSASYEVTKVTSPVAGTSYKYYTDQKLAGKVLFFSGELSGNYLASTENAEKAVDVTVEAVDGGYRLYFIKDSKKIYIDIYEYQTGKAGVQLTETPTCTYVWNESACTFVATVASSDRYLGMYKTYETFSVSATSYITGDNASSVDVSQFPAHLATVKAK